MEGAQILTQEQAVQLFHPQQYQEVEQQQPNLEQEQQQEGEILHEVQDVQEVSHNTVWN